MTKKALQDLYPQWLDADVQMTVADTWETQAIPLPVPRLRRETGDQVQLIEIIRINMAPNVEKVGSGKRISMKLMTKDFDDDPKEGPSTIATTSIEFRGVAIDDFVAIEPWVHEMHDYQGHGYLVAVDTLYVGMMTTGQLVPLRGHIRIYWRFKTVPLAEFLGLIQSQV
ncbi:unnamed protein product [marine sediment metagenome]|uniref:Uncharacterized protein n=1 Tax=marine sediment metagenome TaxID=412755 RepID=X1JWS5_9ZZZZ